MADHHYSQKSLGKLEKAHPKLYKLFIRVGQLFPNTILETERSEEQQRKNVEKGVSKTMKSKHLVGEGIRDKAHAVDAAPDPVGWPQSGKLKKRIEAVAGNLAKPQEDEIMALVGEYVKDVARWYYFGGFVQGVAAERDIDIRWGGDWDSDRQINDQTFDDLPHFEIRNP